MTEKNEKLQKELNDVSIEAAAAVKQDSTAERKGQQKLSDERIIKIVEIGKAKGVLKYAEIAEYIEFVKTL